MLDPVYEASTRTRLSFESAAQSLGIHVLSVTDALQSSSARKGETLEDTAKILSGYADVVIIRHPQRGSAAQFASMASIPVINAGDGDGEHPTQSLVDLFTIREAFGTFKGLRVGLCGDLLYGRTIHSLLRLLVDFDCEVTAISPKELGIPPHILQEIPKQGKIHIETNLKRVLPELDVLYMTRIQKERFSDLAQYEQVRHVYQLDQADLTHAKPHLKILHPLPRVDEIATSVDADARAFYFTQSANGVPVRMALLTAILMQN